MWWARLECGENGRGVLGSGLATPAAGLSPCAHPRSGPYPNPSVRALWSESFFLSHSKSADFGPQEPRLPLRSEQSLWSRDSDGQTRTDRLGCVGTRPSPRHGRVSRAIYLSRTLRVSQSESVDPSPPDGPLQRVTGTADARQGTPSRAIRVTPSESVGLSQPICRTAGARARAGGRRRRRRRKRRRRRRSKMTRGMTRRRWRELDGAEGGGGAETRRYDFASALRGGGGGARVCAPVLVSSLARALCACVPVPLRVCVSYVSRVRARAYTSHHHAHHHTHRIAIRQGDQSDHQRPLWCA